MRLITLLFLFLGATGAAQVPLDSAVLRYHCSRRSVARSGDSVLSYSRVNVAYTPRWLRQDQSGFPGQWAVTIGARGSASATLYATNGTEFVKMEETLPAQLFGLGGWSTTPLRTELLADTATIRGRLCRKALLRGEPAGAADSMEVWYCPDTVLHPGPGLANLFADVPGLPVRFRFRDYPAMSIGPARAAILEYVLFEVETEGFDPAAVPDAARYTWIDESEKMKVLLRVLRPGKR